MEEAEKREEQKERWGEDTWADSTIQGVVLIGCEPRYWPLIRDLAGPEVQVLDSGLAVARQVRRRLAEAGLLASPRAGRDFFWTSGQPARLRQVMETLWGAGIELRPLGEPGSIPGLARDHRPPARG